MSAQRVDDLLRGELLEIARLQARGLSRYEALCRLDLEVDRDPGDRTKGVGGDGEMLDPTWTPERGRSHVAALAGLAEDRQW